MNSHAQVFFDLSTAIRTLLRCAVYIYFAVIYIPLEAHPGKDLVRELPKSSIKRVFTQHSFCHDAEV